ncbi:MAG TPA: SMP-30/gluconolactonase/LRE family protein [Sphingomicrobium sp.]|nr:SMP-30/gluconolactonase/LRE family protein [Sphingomicrobium sp.]
MSGSAADADVRPPDTGTIGTVKSEAPAFLRLVPKAAKIHVVADGFTWAEGPVWIANGGYLLLSDVPKNRMYRWSQGAQTPSIFLEPSGGTETKGFREPGSNGLKPGGPGRLLVADSGHRAIALIDLRTKARRLLVERFEGKRLNSPNDLAVGPDGAIWFTDPPYGLEGIEDSPLKEQSANRVYRLGPEGKVTAVEAELKFPNGIAFSPDGRTLYVSNSDPKNAVILAWDVSRTGKLSRRRVFADMTALAAKGLPGLPDGMTFDERGDLWATGPGGIHVLAPDGRELGLISTGAAISNCVFGGPDGHMFFLTSTHILASLRTNVGGAPIRVPKLAETRK